MNMQTFYKRLSVRSTRSHHRRLANLIRASRAQVLDATRQGTWLVWGAETPNT